ncbi:spore germination protein [Peribacillus deserti]|uniref:Spore germination protein n=1 Tax=Peribacillus deserti TaxID=673318 RepID=A0ABS2QD83_9BACI|nr:LysM peptidoglycan-binding domain-containing protein [Peribacillus deserti]MBM7691126.1 spore germination protein [Peribacillus deserti]
MAVHTVRTGDNLWAISQQYGVSISTITESNGLQSAKLTPGLALYIPVNDEPIRVYRVKAGDNLAQIASRFNTTVQAILARNPSVTPARLVIGQTLVIPSPIKLSLETLGFIVPYNREAFLAGLPAISQQLTYLAIAAFAFTEEGYAYVELNDTGITARSRQLGIIPLLMVRNYRNGNFDAELAGTVLGNPAYRRNLIASLSTLARQRGYGGVSIDIEFIPPARRNDFNLFLRDLKVELGTLILQVNVHAKTEDIPTNRIIGAYDYRTIGSIADLTAVMTIDYGYPGGPPDPISPVWWLAQVIRYSITQINPRKLLIAMALYGYDKDAGTNATRALSVLNAQNQAITLGVPIQFNTAAQSPFYRYLAEAAEHVVWFEDIRSYIQKINQIDLYGLRGTTLWQLSLQAPQLWAYLKQNTTIIK